jgi:hypothetical protein
MDALAKSLLEKPHTHLQSEPMPNPSGRKLVYPLVFKEKT